MWVPPVQWSPGISLGQLRANLAVNGPQLYIGRDGHGLVWAGPQQAMLVLGPPRSGKTSSLVVPNVLAAPGPVLATSTKTDVMQATLASRSELGRCWLLDPTGTVPVPPGVNLIRWSPVQASFCWEEALVTARVMTAAARPHGSYGESAHWTERAEALLAPVLHAAAVSGQGMRQVLGWVLLHDLHTPMALLAQGGDSTGVAIDVLAGIAATEDREKSGIFSTTAGALAAYRSARALALTDGADFDPGRFPFGGGTIYVCAPARYQALTAPVLVAFLEQLRAATYQAATAATLRLPVTLVLDEVANIAPLPDLPAMVSEGGGQGILTLACLQDLSQARARWGTAADGFFSLFGAKVVLPGIGDLRTLDTVSRLAGQGDAAVRSVNASAWWSGRPSASTTWSTRRQERLPVDQAHSLTPGTAIVVTQARPPQLAYLTPWWAYPPFLESRAAPPPALAPGPGPGPGPPRSPVPPPPPVPPGGVAGPAGDLPVTWRRVPGWRRPQAPPPHL
ncbi:MAG: type IV secretory system conjugative DNA transfer family protein [Acidimicrobiales bacterium]